MSSVAPAAPRDGVGSVAGPAMAAGLHASSTFWCYECDVSVALVFFSPPLRCPHCGGDFLEEMEEPPRGPLQSHFHHRSRLLPGELDQPHGAHGGDDDFDAIDDLEDAADRLFSRIVSSASEDIGGATAAVGGGGGLRPASKSAVEAMPTVQITEAFLAADPCLLCAVCKEEFALHNEARRLPCGHIYHPGCILPWLSQHNSCPLCRFLLPTEEGERRRMIDGGDRPHMVLENLLYAMEEEMDRDMREIYDRMRTVFPENTDDPEEVDDDLRDIEVILRRMVGRRRSSFSRRSRLSVAAGSSPAQLAHREIVSGVLATDPDRVLSRSPHDEVTSVGGSGADAGGRVDEEGDVLMFLLFEAKYIFCLVGLG